MPKLSSTTTMSPRATHWPLTYKSACSPAKMCIRDRHLIEPFTESLKENESQIAAEPEDSGAIQEPDSAKETKELSAKRPVSYTHLLSLIHPAGYTKTYFNIVPGKKI